MWGSVGHPSRCCGINGKGDVACHGHCVHPRNALVGQKQPTRALNRVPIATVVDFGLSRVVICEMCNHPDGRGTGCGRYPHRLQRLAMTNRDLGWTDVFDQFTTIV